MSSEPGVSSYDKIFGHLVKCSEFKDVRAAWSERLSAVRFDRWDFRYEQVYDPRTGRSRQEVVTYLYATDGSQIQIMTEGNGKRPSEKLSFSINKEFLLTDEEAAHVVKANFGTKRCKTYFCKLEKVLEGDERRNHRKPSFREMARKELAAETEERIVLLQSTVVAQAEEARLSEAFLKDKQRFFERQVINEIKSVVVKYLDLVDGSVIKEALDEASCAVVMDS